MPDLTPTLDRLGDERAVTTTELVVGILIVLIIGTIAVSQVRTGTANGSLAQGRTLARTLSEGVEQFQRDHGGRLPRGVTSDDWADASPVDAANGRQPYVRDASIEQLAQRNGFILLDGSATAPAGRYAVAINYVVDGTRYAFVVHDLIRNRAECHVTNAAADGAGRAFVATLPARRKC